MLRFTREIFSEWSSRVTGASSCVLVIIALLFGGVPRLVSLSFAILCIYLASYSVWQRTRRQLDKLDAMISGFPRILAATDALRHEFVNFMLASREVVRVSALKLFVTNQPIFNSSDSTAEDVRATLTFRDQEGKLLLSMDARWSDSTTPPERDRFKDITEILAVRFAPGQTRPIDIAFKRIDDDGICYAMNHENYGWPVLQMPDHKLPSGTIIVEADIQAPKLHSIVKLQFINPEDKSQILRTVSYDCRNVFREPA